MILAIFIVPLIYFANAFLLGRFIKRFKISANPFLCTIIGFFGLFTICYLFNIFIYAAHGNIWTYLIFYAIIQAILLIIYAINWRRVFITFSINWKKVATFIVVAGLSVLISWLCLRDFNSEFGVSWVKTITDLPNPNFNNVINFSTVENDVITNFSALNIFNIFWINIFKISGYENCLVFCNWSWIICGSLIMGCIATWLIPDEKSLIKLIISPLICLLYLVIILAFIESFAVCDAWIMVLTFVYVLVLIKKETNSKLKLFFVTLLLLSFLAINSTSFYIIICLWIFSVYWAIRNKENSLNYLVCLSWPVILIIFSFSSFATYWVLSLGNAIMLVVMGVIFVLFARRGSPVWSVKFARSITKNSSKVVYTFVAIILALVLVANLFIFYQYYYKSGNPIDYKNFLTFTYKYIWTFEIKSDVHIAIINTILYAFFIAIIVTFIVIRNVKKSKLYPIAKNDSAIKLAVASAAFFINPLVIHVLKISMIAYQISMPLNTLDLNILLVAPILISLLKINHNYRLREIAEWKYDWY